MGKQCPSGYCERRYFRAYTFCVFPKIGNCAEISIRVFDILTSMLHYKSYFRVVHILCGYFINANNANICTAQKYLRSQST